MTTHFHQIIAKELQLADEQVARTIQLLEEGATIPFISRYRKERTGGLDEIQIGVGRSRNEANGRATFSRAVRWESRSGSWATRAMGAAG